MSATPRPAAAVRPASEVPLGTLAALFNASYADYFVPIRFEEDAFREMLAMFDVSLDDSRVLVEGEEPVAFALLAVRGDRGWIGGMGAPAAHRGGGHGRAAMRAVLDVARERGLRTVDLEVLVQNVHAIPIYEALGFRDVRGLDVWVRDAAPLARPSGAEVDVVPLPAATWIARHAAMHPAEPPWQRALPVLERMAGTLEAHGVVRGGEPRAWVLSRRVGENLRIADVALAAGEPLASLVAALAARVAEAPDGSATLVNLPPDDPASPAMAACGFEVRLRQREMRVALEAASA